MPAYKIGGVSVEFPYNAYDCQLVYMERVINALQQGSNALLESPTGTGKTLCLLCATLAWRASLQPATVDRMSRGLTNQYDPTSTQDIMNPKLPTILYASRTHSQLQQVIRELKATTYRPKMIVLGSREQMCIHTDVRSMRGRAQNHTCRSMVKAGACNHHNRVAEYMGTHPDLGKEPVDIEDLVSIGKTHGPCPYYLSRELHSSADILFLPYNYLIDKENRRSLTGISWEKTVIIFDEAHNLESLCADAASYDLPASHLTGCIGEAKQCVDLAISRRSKDNAADTSMDPDNFAVLKALLLELEKRINEVPIDSTELGFTRPGSYMYEFLAAMKINWDTARMLLDTIEQATSLLEDEASTGAQGRPSSTTYRLQSLRDGLSLIFRGTETSHSSFYKVHIHEVRSKDTDKGMHRGTGGKVSRTLSWWCFNPGIAMEEFAKMGVRSVILTSGTLAPLDSFAYELNLPFKVRLENPHVIDNSQIWVGVVSFGPSGRPLNSSYKTRDSPEYKQELGNAIVNFARIVPDGLLVFFPSYHLLNSCIDAWQSQAKGTSITSSTIWERICKFKQPVVEPRESALFNQANESFMAKLSDESSSGAVFFAVCRGKVSEGLDFADRAGRAVIVTGIPYAMKTDPKVRLKREYLDEAFRSNSGNKGIRGEDWYVQQAARAVNQAVGRVIRHRNDYGAIILCDERFSQGNSQSQMSLWLRPHIKCYSKFGDAAFTLTRFFRDRAGVVKPVLQKPLRAPQHVRVSEKEYSINNSARMIRPDGNGFQSIGKGCLRETFGQSLLGSSEPQQRLSEILAASHAQNRNKSLMSVSIIQANCAVGSTAGFVNEARPEELRIQLLEGSKSTHTVDKDVWVTPLVSQVETTVSIHPSNLTSANGSEQGESNQSSTCCTKDGKSFQPIKKRHYEPVQKPWSLTKHLKVDNRGIDDIAGTFRPLEGLAEKEKGTKETPIQISMSGDGSRERVVKASAEVGSMCHPEMPKKCQTDSLQSKERLSVHTSVSSDNSRKVIAKPSAVVANVQCPEQLQDHQIGFSKSKTRVPGPACTQKTKNAAGFLQEVKAHLNVVEYKRFLECMKSLKNQLISMASLLQTVSNLFSAPERLFLFRRFGDFIPSQHRKLYDDCLAARCEELGYTS